jgi:HK97 family phage portal protein
MALLSTFLGWFRGGGALSERRGEQRPLPTSPLVDDTQLIGSDGALQIAAVWSCIERRANVIASLPYFVYERLTNGQKDLARTSRLYALLHESPNARMTPFEFWRAMIMNHDLRGNAYARIERDPRTQEAISLWPMPADQVTPYVMPDGQMVYQYRIETDVAILSSDNVFHLKNLGNGTVGLSKLEFMRATTDEAAKAQNTASKLFGTHGKPTGVLMVDSVLNEKQRDAIRKNFGEMALGNTGRLYVLEAKMEYKQLALSPEDQQLLESRHFGIEEVCRWFDVPPVLAHHSNVTTWGSGIDSILDGWYKLSVRPMLVSIEQAVRKQVMTAAQRTRMTAEFSLDALLRGNAKDRAELYAQLVQNGIATRAECRQLENLPPIEGADQLTAQTNLAPLSLLGKNLQPAKEAPKETVLQSATIIDAQNKAMDQRHMEVLSLIKAGANSQASPVVVDLGKAIINVTHQAPAAPVVHVSNLVNPTPVNVEVTNEVAPTPVDVTANFEATIEPAKVELSMPTRRTEGTVIRNDKGDIVKTITTESNV